MPRDYRLKYWNYKGRGIYMITMNIEGRVPLLGVLQGSVDDARVEYSLLVYEEKDIEAEVYSKAGTLPHTALRYKFLTLNALIRKLCNN